MATEYIKALLPDNKGWAIFEAGHNYLAPQKGCTFALDTETQVYFDGKILEPKKLAKRIKRMNTEQKRKRVTNAVWAWQCYDEANGFFMTNDFDTYIDYIARAGLKFGWCYNATFDFAQIDYKILAEEKDKWHPHEKGTGKAYDKGQAWTYQSINNDMGSRYAYKLWVPYKNVNRHVYVHAFEIHDFMKILVGGLKNVLNDLDVRDNDGNPLRKLEMEYQEVKTDNLTQAEIEYCAMDVKGLYFAVKKFNQTIEEQSNGECHIFGEETNLMTAGGFAKRELLRSMYPNSTPKKRIIKFQQQHPITAKQDKWLRDNHLYRGGISFVNPLYRGQLLTKEKMGRAMNRYDVNSEYPYSMSIIRDLVGTPFKIKYGDYLAMEDKENYECCMVLTAVSGEVKKGYLGMWYDPFKKEYVTIIDEEGTHLMFEREFNEMMNWYDDVEYSCDWVILWKRGEYVYRPFVEENYSIKAEAKKEKNKTLQACTKLKLNSSYGKLSERIERVEGHYELNEKTGAIHFVADGIEESTNGAMNVAIGSLITATARCYILFKIREICHGENMHKEFVYIDTDSIHAFSDYSKADPFTLGGLKLEATCEAVKYIAPKTYIDIEHVNKDGTINLERVNKDGTINLDNVEVHSKGVTTKVVLADLKKKQKGKRHNLPTLELIDRKINYGVKYLVLVAMNVKGGKVLLPTEKYLATDELRPDETEERLGYSNYSGSSYLMEA